MTVFSNSTSMAFFVPSINFEKYRLENDQSLASLLPYLSSTNEHLDLSMIFDVSKADKILADIIKKSNFDWSIFPCANVDLNEYGFKNSRIFRRIKETSLRRKTRKIPSIKFFKMEKKAYHLLSAKGIWIPEIHGKNNSKTSYISILGSSNFGLF